MKGRSRGHPSMFTKGVRNKMDKTVSLLPPSPTTGSLAMSHSLLDTPTNQATLQGSKATWLPRGPAFPVLCKRIQSYPRSSQRETSDSPCSTTGKRSPGRLGLKWHSCPRLAQNPRGHSAATGKPWCRSSPRETIPPLAQSDFRQAEYRSLTFPFQSQEPGNM